MKRIISANAQERVFGLFSTTPSIMMDIAVRWKLDSVSMKPVDCGIIASVAPLDSSEEDELLLALSPSLAFYDEHIQEKGILVDLNLASSDDNRLDSTYPADMQLRHGSETVHEEISPAPLHFRHIACSYDVKHFPLQSRHTAEPSKPDDLQRWHGYCLWLTRPPEQAGQCRLRDK